MSDFNSSLPVRTEANGDIVAQLCDATATNQKLAIDAAGAIASKLKDGAGNDLTSSAAGALQALDVQLTDSSGERYSALNPMPVTMTKDNVGAEIDFYATGSAVAAAAVSNHDYTVTAGKTLLLTQIEASSSGKMKIEVQIETAAGSGTFSTKFVKFNSTSNPNLTIILQAPIAVAAGVKVRVARTNKDMQAQDLFSSICGQEV